MQPSTEYGLSLAQWSALVAAANWYQAAGYKPVAANWHANLNAISMTLPSSIDASCLRNRSTSLAMVGSAEQSYLDLVMQQALPLNQMLVALTPCFRIDDADAATCHHPYFAKVELGIFHTVPAGQPVPTEPAIAKAFQMMDHARQVVHKLYGVHPLVDNSVGGLSISNPLYGGTLVSYPLVDLTINGVEIGSFGWRLWYALSGSSILWAYGTGLAEPRTSWAIETARVKTPE